MFAKGVKMQGIKIYDGGEQYADRYIVMFPGYVRTMSYNALSPGGCNIYGGKSWVIRDEPEVAFDDLPKQVQEAIRRELTEEEM